MLINVPQSNVLRTGMRSAKIVLAFPNVIMQEALKRLAQQPRVCSAGCSPETLRWAALARRSRICSGVRLALLATASSSCRNSAMLSRIPAGRTCTASLCLASKQGSALLKGRSPPNSPAIPVHGCWRGHNVNAPWHCYMFEYLPFENRHPLARK